MAVLLVLCHLRELAKETESGAERPDTANTSKNAWIVKEDRGSQGRGAPPSFNSGLGPLSALQPAMKRQNANVDYGDVRTRVSYLRVAMSVRPDSPLNFIHIFIVFGEYIQMTLTPVHECFWRGPRSPRAVSSVFSDVRATVRHAWEVTEGNGRIREVISSRVGSSRACGFVALERARARLRRAQRGKHDSVSHRPRGSE